MHNTHNQQHKQHIKKHQHHDPPQPPASSGFNILMVSVIALRHAVAHNLRNMAMLLIFHEINSSFILFSIILFAADQRTWGQKVCFLQWINVHFYCSLRESMRTNPICPPIFFYKAAQVLIMFWHDFGQGRGGASWSPWCLREERGDRLFLSS